MAEDVDEEGKREAIERGLEQAPDARRAKPKSMTAFIGQNRMKAHGYYCHALIRAHLPSPALIRTHAARRKKHSMISEVA